MHWRGRPRVCRLWIRCGGSYGSSLPIGALPVALAFGLTVTALIYALGPISGCHINPAVTLALWAAGRFQSKDVPGYVAAQLAGGIAGAGLLVVILGGKLGGHFDVASSGLGQNGWGTGYLGQYGVVAAFVTEFITTAIFLLVILGATSKESTAEIAGLAIGAALTVIIAAFINVTGVSLNPARSLGPALFVGSHALSQVWLFFVAPLLAALLVGFAFRASHRGVVSAEHI
jgi:aquaporin Z